MGPVQSQAKPKSWLTKVPVGAKNIKFGPKWIENRGFGLKLGPEACQDRSGDFGMGLTQSKGPSPAKKVKKCARAAPGFPTNIHSLGIGQVRVAVLGLNARRSA